jgi:undecaprenyl pyrophosphate phosphatase UppP
MSGAHGRFPLVPRGRWNLDAGMPSRDRRRFTTLIIVLFVVLCVLVPGFLYFTELALRQLRFMWWLILLIGVLLWLLARPRPKE